MAAVHVSPRMTRAARRGGRADSLSRQFQEALDRGAQPQALLDRYAAARRAFSELSGVVRVGPQSADDIQRLRILDAVILELSAVEREIFVAVGDDPPEAIRTAYAELLERLNGRPAEPDPSPAPEPTLMDRLRAGEAVRLHLEVDRLTPAGLVAVGHLLHFEPDVRVVEDGGTPKGQGAAGPAELHFEQNARVVEDGGAPKGQGAAGPAQRAG